MPRPAPPEAPLRPGRVCAAPPSSARARGAAASPPPAPTPSLRVPAVQGGPEGRGTWRLVPVDAMVEIRGVLYRRRRPAAAPSSRARVTAAPLRRLAALIPQRQARL